MDSLPILILLLAFNTIPFAIWYIRKSDDGFFLKGMQWGSLGILFIFWWFCFFGFAVENKNILMIVWISTVMVSLEFLFFIWWERKRKVGK